ncbi:MAG: LemA family protein [Candidatus Gastranaerophilales bacterium]|nr:LemA family protein [Candidatus Gastranaerophilales bacterium]
MTQSQLMTFLPIIILAVIFIWVVMVYNGLVVLKNQVKNAWSQIDVQLKRRYDLIPNLVETVKGYAAHEKSALEAVIKARQTAINIDNVKDKAVAENALSGALKSLFAVAENYPDLKANENFLQLQEEITSTENKISYARQFYNDSVLEYNNKKEMFPTNMIATIFNFEHRDFFEASVTEKEAPQVKF